MSQDGVSIPWLPTGISRDSVHKRRSTGGKRTSIRKKRKFELGRPAANTKVTDVQLVKGALFRDGTVCFN